MATTDLVPVKKLIIDLQNFRTVPQDTERDAIHALITIAPDKFWALMDSLLANGYFLTENILVLRTKNKLYVREGNRRVSALKIILGQVTVPNLTIPSEIENRIAALSKEWMTENAKIPCAIYGPGEIKSAGRIVSLTHGKSEPAGRSQWNAVARARHNRSEGASEPALDLLEKYVSNGKNLTPEEAELWAGEYHLTVLEEALQTVSPRLGFATTRDLANMYPALQKQKSALDNMICDIGRKTLDFPAIRNKGDDFAQTKYNILPLPIQSPGSVSGGQNPSTTPVHVSGTAPPISATTNLAKKTKAVAVSDSRAVTRALKQFQPKGKNREKLVTLLHEARGLKLRIHPHSFCFLLRSMFELSAKAYCLDYAGSGGPSATKPNGDDKKLVEILNDVTGHLTKNKTDKTMLKRLHGAMAELKKPHGFLSVTSMNQLIHSAKFVVDETHICNLFFNIFPLLEDTNK
jgi:hypothetical protein